MSSIKSAIKVIGLTIATFGLYGAYWAMKNAFKEPDISEDDLEKDSNTYQRAVASAVLMRHDFH